MPKLVKVDFVKGHMGGNEIVLLDGTQMPKSNYVEVARSVLEPPGIRGDQAGILEKPRHGGDVKVEIVDRTTRDFITMCGGLTQVLFRAMTETDFRKRYRIRPPLKELVLEMPLGNFRISAKGRSAAFTEMTKFVEECYRLGVSSIEVADVKATRVGKFLVADVNEVQRKYPETNFETMPLKTREVLMEMQADFDKQHFYDAPNADYCIFGMYDNDLTHGRVLFPHDIAGGHIEPSCGTGSTAVAIALAHTNRLVDGDVSLRFDSGGEPILGGPETTEVNVVQHRGKVTSAEFSHSLVEIISTGTAWYRIH